MVQKIYSKMHLVSCTNTHRDVTYLVNHGMVKNTKTCISWERNIIFLRNKKKNNLCFRWHILKSYRFVAEVTFKGWLNTFLPKHFLTLTSVLTLNCFFMRTNNVQRKDRTLVLMIFCFTYKYPPYFGGIVLIKTSIKVSVVDPFITKIHQKTMAIPRSKRRSIILPSDPNPSLTIKITFLPPTKKCR